MDRYISPGDEPAIVYSVPREVVAHFDADDGLRWAVTLYLVADDEVQAHVVDEIRVRRLPGGPAASAVAMREVPVGALVEDAIRAAMERWRIDGDRMVREHFVGRNKQGLYIPPPAPSSDAVAVHTRHRKNGVTDDECLIALRMYEDAKAAKVRGALEHVAAQLGISRSSAHERIRRGREIRK